MIKWGQLCEMTPRELLVCLPFPCGLVHEMGARCVLPRQRSRAVALCSQCLTSTGSGSRLQPGATPRPALPAGCGPEAALPRVFDCGFQHPESGLRVLREGGLPDLHSTLRSDLPADAVPRLAFGYGAFRWAGCWRGKLIKVTLGFGQQSLLLMGAGQELSPQFVDGEADAERQRLTWDFAFCSRENQLEFLPGPVRANDLCVDTLHECVPLFF